MSRAPNWTRDEFETLLRSNHLSDEELAENLPLRSSGAVGIVRSGIHSYHRGLNVSMLSKIMLQRLDEGPQVKCPKCGTAI